MSGAASIVVMMGVGLFVCNCTDHELAKVGVEENSHIEVLFFLHLDDTILDDTVCLEDIVFLKKASNR